MNKEKILQRKCVACRKIFPRNELIRIMKEHNTGKIILMPDNKTFGRSCYICSNDECLKTAIKKKSIQRNLKTTRIDEEFIEKLKSYLN